MGRTGRAGSEGNALSFVSSQDNRKWYAIECLLDPSKKLSSTPKSGFKKKKTGFSSSGRKPQNAVSAYGGGNRKREFN
jgi:superfamily II DNA/RNA helicase